MTVEQFNLLRVGDEVIDMASSRRKRKILSIKRHSGKPSQGGKVRVSLTVTNLKSHGQKTIIFVSPELGALRFEFPEEHVGGLE
jgi:hypothetical protein